MYYSTKKQISKGFLKNFFSLSYFITYLISRGRKQHKRRTIVMKKLVLAAIALVCSLQLAVAQKADADMQKAVDKVNVMN